LLLQLCPWAEDLPQKVLQQMVLRAEKGSHKEVVRIGVGEEDEDKDKTGASSKRRLFSLAITAYPTRMA